MNKVKLILSVIVVSAIFLAGIYSKVEDLLFADKMDQMEVQIKGDVSSLILAYQAENKFLRQWVQLVNENTAKNINWNSILPYFAIAQLNTNLQVVEWSFRDKSPVSSMSKENLTQLINSFHIKTTDKNIHHFVYSDAEKKKIFLTLVPQGQRLWVFVSQGENLQSIMDGLKASSYMLALINDDFLSLANVKSEYIGQRIFENQILSQIKNGSKTSASGSFKINSGEEFFAFYQRVPNSDMYVYSQVSLDELINNRKAVKRQFVIFSIGFLFILASIMMILVPKESRKFSPVLSIPVEPNQTTVPFSSVALEKNETSDASKVDGYMKIAAIIGHEVKGPIVKILNSTTAILGKLTQTEDKVALQELQKEIREAKAIADKLLVFAGEKNSEKIETKIEAPLLRAIKAVDPLLLAKSVKIEKDFQDLPVMPIDVSKISTAFENILKNSIQSLERKPGKIIKIKTYEREGKLVTEIQDNGDGIDKELLSKIFDPFFTTKAQPKNIGLGLSMALGIVKEHGGQIVVESEKGKGTKMIIEFPKPMLENTKGEEISSHQGANAQVSSSDLIDVPKLNIPDTGTVDVMTQMAESQESNIVDISTDEDEQIEAVSEIKEVNNESHLILDEVSTDKNSESLVKLDPLKPVDLNINVDELFEMQQEDIPPVPENKNIEEAVLNQGSGSLIVPPKQTTLKVQVKESDDFKVFIRKPKGRV